MKVKFGVLKRLKGKRKFKAASALLAVILILTIAGKMFFGKRAVKDISAEMAVQSATAETGSISTTVSGTGALQGGTTQDLIVPAGIKIKKVLVESGDTIKKGQKLATVDEASVAAELLEVEESLDDVEDEIDDLSDEAEEEGTTEYLEAIVLKEKRKELKKAKTALKELMDTKAIKAEKAGIIGEINVSDNTELSSASDSTQTDFSSDSSSAVNTSVSGTSAVSEITAVNAVAANKASAVNVSAVNKITADSAVAANKASAVNTSAANKLSAVNVSTADEDMTVTIAECSISVAEPVTGNKPQTTISSTEQFSGTISWNSTDDVFQAGTSYTAEIKLTAKDGYVFSNNVNVTVSGASSVEKSVSGNVLTITASFAKTEEAGTEATTESTASSQENQTTENTENSMDSTAAGTDNTKQKKATSPDSSGNTLSGKTAGSAAVSGSTGTSTSTGTDETEYSPYEAVAFTIISNKEMIISINVDELDILSVEEGQSAVVTLDALEDQEFEGTITSISSSSTGDSSSAKYPVEITMEKTDDMMLGMSASATINVDEADNAVLIPVSALQEEGDSTFVYTQQDKEGNLSGKVEISTGLSDGSQVAVTSGLEEGDTVYYLKMSTDTDSEHEQKMGGNMGDMPSGGAPGSGGGPSSGGGSGSGGRPQ